MKLKCNCGEILTKDLYPTKNWHCYDVVEDYYGECGTKHYMEVKGGSFLLSKQIPHIKKMKRYPQGFWVNSNDILDSKQLKYRRGYGCCGLAWEPFICPKCKETIGEINLDCYQDHRVELYETKVGRIYK